MMMSSQGSYEAHKMVDIKTTWCGILHKALEGSDDIVLGDGDEQHPLMFYPALQYL